MVVPLGWEAAETSAASPPSTTTFVAAPSPVEVVREKEETLAIEGSASPLNPRVVTASMSSTFWILLVACLSTERRGVAPGHPRSVVADEDARGAAVSELHLDAGGACVEGVLDEFLDHRGRAVDDLPGGHLLGHPGVEDVDARACSLLLGHGSCGIVHPGAGFPTGWRVESLAMPETDENRLLPLREVEQLVELLRESGVGEIRVRQGETEISVKARPEVPATPFGDQVASATQGVPDVVESEPRPRWTGCTPCVRP